MGKNKRNEYADGFSGKIGRNMVFRQTKSEEVIIARKPRKTDKPPHIKRLATQRLFKRGALYAKTVESNPEQKMLYAASAKGLQSAFNLALRDFCRPPKVDSIDRSGYQGRIGDRIIIEATDDFKVASVQVAIYTIDHELVEQGVAVLEGLDWVYTATEDHIALEGSTIKATAKDLPGNEGSLEITL